MQFNKLRETEYIKPSKNEPLENLNYDALKEDGWSLYFFSEGEIEAVVQYLDENCTKKDARVYSINTAHLLKGASIENDSTEEFGSYVLIKDRLAAVFQTMTFSACRLIFCENREFIIFNDFSDYFVVGLEKKYRFGVNGYKFTSMVFTPEKIVREDLQGEANSEWLRKYFRKFASFLNN